MKRTPPPPPTRKNQVPTNRPRPAPSEPIEIPKQQQNSDPPQVLTQQMPKEQVLNSIPEQTVSSPNQLPNESVAQQAMPQQAIEQPPVDQQLGQPAETIQGGQSPTFPAKSAVRPKAGPPPAKSKLAAKGRAPPPPPKTIPRNSPPKDIVKVEEKMNVCSPPEPQIEETQQIFQGQSLEMTQNVMEPQRIPFKEAEPEKEVIPSRIEVPIIKGPPVPPPTKANNNKGKKLPPQAAFNVPPQQQLQQQSEVQYKEPESQPEPPLNTPVKVESRPMSIPQDNSIDNRSKIVEQVAPGSSNSKLYEKMLKLRQAKQEMAKDSDEDSEVQQQDAEDEVERQEEQAQNDIKQEVKAFQDEREDKIIEKQVMEIQEGGMIAIPPQETSNKISPPPKSNRQAPPPKTIPLPTRSAPKPQAKKMQAPPPTTYQHISTTVAQQTQPENQRQQEIKPIAQNLIENQSEPNPFPPAPIDPSPEVEHQTVRPHLSSRPAHSQNPLVTVSLSKPQSPLLSEINSLLDRYHTLKSSYLSNIHDLQQQLNFQKQQEDAQVDKINHLIAQLGKKNMKIKEICIGKAQTLIEEEQIMGSAAV